MSYRTRPDAVGAHGPDPVPERAHRSRHHAYEDSYGTGNQDTTSSTTYTSGSHFAADFAASGGGSPPYRGSSLGSDPSPAAARHRTRRAPAPEETWVTDSAAAAAAAESAGRVERRHARVRGQGGEGQVQTQEEAEERARQLADSNVNALRDTLSTVRASEESGAATLQMLHEQSEQMRRVEHDLDRTNHSLSLSHRVLGGMRSFGSAIGNMFTSAPHPPPAMPAAPAPLEPLQEHERQGKKAAGVPRTAPGRRAERERGHARGDDLAAAYAGVEGGKKVGKGEGSNSEDATLAYVAKQREEEEMLLDDISATLDTLKLQSTTMNRELGTQTEALGRIDTKMVHAQGRMREQTKVMDDMLR